MQISLSKTWLTSASWRDYLVETTAVLRSAGTILAYKNLLVGAGWTVEQSSNGTALGTGAGDHWTTISDVITAIAGSAHSWAVLSNATFLPGFQVLLDYGPSALVTYRWTANFGACSTGYNSDGTYLVRPTAAGTEALFSDVVFADPPEYGVSGTTLLYSSDNQCYRLFTTHNGYCGDNYGGETAYGGSVITIERPLNPDDAWTNPFVFGVYFASTGTAGGWSYATISNDATVCKTVINSRSTPLVISSFARYSSASWIPRLARHNGAGVSGRNNLYPVYFLCDNGGGNGVLGKAADLYVATLTSIQCMRFPTVGNTRGLIKMGMLATGAPDDIVEVF